jgi:hypothetical protein
LIELMVGMIISTLIIGAASTVFVTTLNSWERGSRQYEMIQRVQKVSDVIELHMRSSVSTFTDPTAVFYGEDLSDGSAYGHHLTIISTAQSRFPRNMPLSDASEIDFFFDPAEGGGLSMRIDSLRDDSPYNGGYWILLDENIVSFRIRYYSGLDEAWVDEWISYDDVLTEEVESIGVPLALQFELEFSFENPNGGSPYEYFEQRLVALPLSHATEVTFAAGAAAGEIPPQ